jgi:hypothetical protein
MPISLCEVVAASLFILKIIYVGINTLLARVVARV